MILDHFQIATRNLRRRKLRSWLTMIGIIIGITAVVSLISMGQGLKVAITSQFGDVGTDKLTIQASGGFGPPGTAVVRPLTKETLRRIEQVNGVKISAGRLVRAGKLEFNSKTGFGYAESLPDGEARTLVEASDNLEPFSGRLLRNGDSGKIVVGNNLYSQDVGFGKPITVGSKVLVQGKPFVVIGVLQKKGNFILDNSILVNEQDVRDTFNISSEVYDIITVQVQDGANINSVQSNIERLLRKERDVKEGEEDFTVQTPQAIIAQVNSTLFAVQIFVYIIAGISIVVGGIGIMNTMFTSVLERTRDIGIMKAIGARNSTIFSLFFVESGLIGMIGGIVGALCGAGLATLLAFLGRSLLGGGIVRAEISIWLILSSIFGAFLLGSVFGIIPAMRASKLHPVDALKRK
jgi:putative ABC transport system permease protein